MTMGKIKYRSGYKYQLAEDYTTKIAILPSQDIQTEFIDLNLYGILTIKKGYAWDGPSGPTIDTKSFMRGSIIHDALYQLIRQERISMTLRKIADDELKKACLEDGMWSWRAWYAYKAVRSMAFYAANPENQKEVYEAP